ncbi:MAG: isoprenylcysteine carboxylmethyltransferase family protein [Rickettsiales bacterium]
MSNPKLLKARQYHSRIFAVLLVGLLLVSKPMLEYGSLSRELLLWFGYALVAFGAFGRVYCSVFIGGRKNDEVVRSGPFSVVRNPLYVFSFIAMVGIGMQSGMLSLIIFLVVSFMVYYPFVIGREEDFLEHKFGEPYSIYKQEVPRWLPNFKLWVEPEHMEAKPKFIRRTIFDALIFFLPMPCFALINYLQVGGVLPVWLSLP